MNTAFTFNRNTHFFIYQGTTCDLITGEERRHASLFNTIIPDADEIEPENVSETENLLLDEIELTPSSHVACTVEMTSLNNKCKFTSHMFNLVTIIHAIICTYV